MHFLRLILSLILVVRCNWHNYELVTSLVSCLRAEIKGRNGHVQRPNGAAGDKNCSGQGGERMRDGSTGKEVDAEDRGIFLVRTFCCNVLEHCSILHLHNTGWILDLSWNWTVNSRSRLKVPSVVAVWRKQRCCWKKRLDSAIRWKTPQSMGKLMMMPCIISRWHKRLWRNATASCRKGTLNWKSVLTRWWWNRYCFCCP